MDQSRRMRRKRKRYNTAVYVLVVVAEAILVYGATIGIQIPAGAMAMVVICRNKS